MQKQNGFHVYLAYCAARTELGFSEEYVAGS